MQRVVEYSDKLSNVRLEQLGDNLFQVVLSGRTDLTSGSGVTDADRANGLVTSSEVINPAVPEAVKSAFATSIAPVTLSGADFNGSWIDTTSHKFTGGRITIAAVAQPGAYSTNNITVSKIDAPTMSEVIAFTTANGGETITTSKRFYGLISIALPAMGSALGTLRIGVAENRQMVAVPYPIRVQQPSMEAAITNAFKILNRLLGDTARRQLGRTMGPGEIVAFGTKTAWARRMAELKWFGHEGLKV